MKPVDIVHGETKVSVSRAADGAIMLQVHDDRNAATVLLSDEVAAALATALATHLPRSHRTVLFSGIALFDLLGGSSYVDIPRERRNDGERVSPPLNVTAALGALKSPRRTWCPVCSVPWDHCSESATHRAQWTHNPDYDGERS